MPSDGILGIGVLSAVAFVVLVVILNKSEDEPMPSTQHYTKAVRVIDGDTIEVESNKFRLFGIDSPERG